VYQAFREAFQAYSVITWPNIRRAFRDFDPKNLVYWQRKGYLIRLRNGHYALAERKITELTLFQIANLLYGPSYVSLETALSYHGIIPEAVVLIQSVATPKTYRVSTPLGEFQYRSLQPRLYLGYQLIPQAQGPAIRMANPEKAILDFLYLRPDIHDQPSFEALRWNKDLLTRLDFEQLKHHTEWFYSPTLSRKVHWLKKNFYA
jgi:hypothetical protein